MGLNCAGRRNARGVALAKRKGYYPVPCSSTRLVMSIGRRNGRVAKKKTRGGTETDGSRQRGGRRVLPEPNRGDNRPRSAQVVTSRSEEEE